MPVFGLIIAMDVITGLLALFVLKPWRAEFVSGSTTGAMLQPAE